MSVETLRLESYLKQLGLTTFVRNHAAFAADAAHNQSSYGRYLLALAEQEVSQREANSGHSHPDDDPLIGPISEEALRAEADADRGSPAEA